MCGLSISMKSPLQTTDSSKPIADNGNWLAAVVLIAGINFLLQLEQIRSGMPIFTMS
jgi:hypothetical protein